MATLNDLTEIPSSKLAHVGLSANTQIKHLTVLDLDNLFFLLKLEPDGIKMTAIATLEYLLFQAVALNKQIF